MNRDLLAYGVAVPNLAHATELIDAEKLVDHTSCYPISFKNSVYVLTKYNLDGELLSLFIGAALSSRPSSSCIFL